MRCPDCKGSKIYQPFFGPEEKCANCNGAGEVADATGTAIAAALKEDGAIRFSVTSDGTTGPEWIERLKKEGFRIGDCAHSILYSPDFRPTDGVTTEINVFKGDFFKDGDRTTRNIRAEAASRGLTKPNAEAACLIREKFTNKEIEAMGLCGVIAMHEPIKDSDGNPRLLGASRPAYGRWLNAYYDGSDVGWYRGYGFAFVIAQVSS